MPDRQSTGPREGAAREKGGGGQPTQTEGAPSSSLVSDTGMERGTPTNHQPPSPPPPLTYARVTGGSNTAEQVASGVATRPTIIRPFLDIIKDASTNRNILEIHITKTLQGSMTSNVTTAKATGAREELISFDTMADFLFSHLQIDPNTCITYNHSLSNPSTKELAFQPGFKIPNKYIDSWTITKGSNTYFITTKLQSGTKVRLVFRECPLSIPDDEILHIAKTFCNPTDDIVHYEQMNSKGKSIRSGTRYLEVELKPGVVLPTYFWLEGPLEGDRASRVSVSHSGHQVRQCYHCLEIGSRCSFNGSGKVCKGSTTTRARVSDYKAKLEGRYSYCSLKDQFFRSVKSSRSTAATSAADDDNINELERLKSTANDDVTPDRTREKSPAMASKADTLKKQKSIKTLEKEMKTACSKVMSDLKAGKQVDEVVEIILNSIIPKLKPNVEEGSSSLHATFLDTLESGVKKGDQHMVKIQQIKVKISDHLGDAKAAPAISLLKPPGVHTSRAKSRSELDNFRDRSESGTKRSKSQSKERDTRRRIDSSCDTHPSSVEAADVTSSSA